jgi:NADH-quinone oxidoreductase subunit C
VSVADGRQTIEQIRSAFPDAVVGEGEYRDQHWAEIKLSSVVEVCSWLRDEQGYNYCVDVTAAHWPDQEPPVEIIYHLYSFDRNDRLRLKARAADGEPVPSVTGIWKSADWNERETYDMFGIRFEGHPDLRRILMPDDYTDFPLRKEFPLYRG